MPNILRIMHIDEYTNLNLCKGNAGVLTPLGPPTLLTFLDSHEIIAAESTNICIGSSLPTQTEMQNRITNLLLIYVE